MKTLNERKLAELLEFINKYQTQNGRSPSYRTIMKAMRFTNLASVFRYVGRLEADGKIQKNDFGGIKISRKLNPDRTIIAPLLGTVTCGQPILAVENIEGTYSLPADIFGTGETFLLHAKGQSMIDAGIKDKDILVVRKCQNADDGDIVVALIDEEATVKRFFKKRNRIVLHPENKEYKDIIVDNVQILGKVISCIHNF